MMKFIKTHSKKLFPCLILCGGIFISSNIDNVQGMKFPKNKLQNINFCDIEDVREIDGFIVKYIKNQGYSIVGCNFSDASIYIPDSLGDLPIVSIAPEAFKNSDISELTFKGPIREIGESAFERCVNLKSLTFCNDVGVIKEKAFKDCPSLLMPYSIERVAPNPNLPKFNIPAYYTAPNPNLPKFNINVYGIVDQIAPNAFEGCINNNYRVIIQGYDKNLLEHTLVYAILNNNLDDLQDILCSNPNTNISQISIPTFLDQSSIVAAKIPVTAYAALCGSTECFKYLYINGGKDLILSQGQEQKLVDTLSAAIASGNPEIIRIVSTDATGKVEDKSHYFIPYLIKNLYGCAPNKLNIINWAYESQTLDFSTMNSFNYYIKQSIFSPNAKSGFFDDETGTFCPIIDRITARKISKTVFRIFNELKICPLKHLQLPITNSSILPLFECMLHEYKSKVGDHSLVKIKKNMLKSLTNVACDDTDSNRYFLREAILRTFDSGSNQE